MAWMKSSVRVIFVLGAAIFCWSGIAKGDAPTYKGFTDGCLLPVNLVRTARLDTRVGLVAKDATLETTVVGAMQTATLAGNDSGNCSLTGTTTPTSQNVKGVLMTLQYPSAQITAANCVTAVAIQLREGLNALATYAQQPWADPATAPYTSASAQNLVYMGYGASTTMGCGISECTGGTNVVLCRLAPTISAGDVPFSEAFFKALKSRGGIDLSTLSEKDLDTDSSGRRHPSGAAKLLGMAGALPAVSLTLTSLLGMASFR